jgi:hypothetical protein
LIAICRVKACPARRTRVTAHDMGDTLVPVPFTATLPVEPQPNLSSATVHPEQVEAPEGNEDQGTRGQSQQHDNCFQHRLTPLVWRKHARLSRNCHHSVPGKVRMKPFSAADENVLKQTAVYLVVNKTGTADMQFIFDLIWNQSRSRFLATIHEGEAGQ